MQGFKGGQELLKGKFHLNPLVVMWIGILRSKNIFLTEPVLELCKPGAPLEEVFKDRTILASVDNQVLFNEFQNKHNCNELLPLVILDNGTEKVIALQDEILAEEGWKEKETDEKNLPSTQAEMSLAIDSNIQGVAHLFTDDEIANLKITIATAVSSSSKIEAIRKISLSQMKPKEKSLLFLHILGDEDVTVRIEAAKSLERTGLNSQITNAIATIFSGDKKQKLHALDSMGSSFEDASEFEKGVILQVFLTTMKDKNYHDYVIPIVIILTKIIAVLPTNKLMVERIMNICLENLISDFDLLQEKMFYLFETLKKHNEEQVAEFLWKEVKRCKERHLRTLILTLLAKIKNENSGQIKMMMIEEMGLGDELDPVYIRLTNTLKSFGEDILPQLTKRFRISKRITEKLQLLQLMNELITTETSVEVKNQMIEMFIHSFATTHKLLRSLIMESKLLTDSHTDEKLRLQMAKEVLLDLENDTVDEYPEAIRSCLCRMKSVAITAILQVISNPMSSEQAVFATSVLGDVVLVMNQNITNEVMRIKDFCLKQLETRKPHVEELYRALGKLATLTEVEKETACEIVEYLLENICKSGRPYAVIDAISWAAASPNITQELKFNMSYLFISLFNRNLPGNLTKDSLVKNEALYEIDSKTTAFTDLIPTVMNGLCRLVCCVDSPVSLQKKIIDTLMKRWKDVLAYRIIWGPKNTLQLAEALQKITFLDKLSISTKVEIIESLMQKIEIFSIAELLVDVFAQDFSSEEMIQLAQVISTKLLEFNKDKEFQNPEDKAVIMRCIGKMAIAKQLAIDTELSEQNRERLIYVLFEGLRDNIFRIRPILQDVLDSPNVSSSLKVEIKKRLPEL